LTDWEGIARNSVDTIQAIILGAIQGLTEFIPISSSAHLIVIPWLFGWKPFGLAFDVALHLGTLLALIAYFWRDWYGLLRDSVGRGKLRASPDHKTMLLWPIIIANIPAALAGKFFEHTIEDQVRSNFLLIGIVTISLGILLFAADRCCAKRRPAEAVTLRDWMVIGIAQALALVPGVSRSGVTITAGLACGLQRDAAAWFSFLLGAPIILGAAVYELPDALKSVLAGGEWLQFTAGIAASAVVGYLCIGFLMSYLRKRSTGLFVGYRLVFGLGVILLSLLR
jgi:undecaprenyl-diphosphatase